MKLRVGMCVSGICVQVCIILNKVCWLLCMVEVANVLLALAVRHGSVNAALRPTDKLAGSVGACK